jgi:hypothetical protein
MLRMETERDDFKSKLEISDANVELLQKQSKI